ncbi:prephenate dehydrogenase [Marinicrinis lubricantis]|uniref:Prephenate dehydrogenase n=1 Tax=Marinicrinis lubricantis TaxID=2086470 RepID=A0ABW1ILZ8_9BACL
MIKVAICGVGLIGGSLALCLKDRPGYHVIGHSPNPASVQKYLEREVVDEATTSLQEAVQDADYIFLCVPVGKLESYLQQLKELSLKKGCVITDVGSTKQSVMQSAEALAIEDVYFIGGHPMAGSERSGVEAASSHLFENAFYVLTPSANTPEEVFAGLKQLLELTRAKIIRVDSALHDDIVGAISHLPHIIAVALVNQVASYHEQNDLYGRLAAGGFRDITRIASSDPVIWRDILTNNKEVLLHLLKDWQAEIDRFVKMLENGDGEAISAEFERANRFRSGLPERRKGMITSLFDVYVDVPDHPGVIGHIASELGTQQISLSNIQVIESREDVPGVLRLSFRNENDLERAVQVLKQLSYRVHF